MLTAMFCAHQPNGYRAQRRAAHRCSYEGGMSPHIGRVLPGLFSEIGSVIDHGSVLSIFRCLQGPDGPASSREEGELLKIRVSLPSYKLVYEHGTEEMMWRVRGRKEEEGLKVQAQARAEKRRKCLYLV
jgi:hypothetical protein